MSAGPKSVAPVSRPATARMTLCIKCSMKGRATTMRRARASAESVSHFLEPLFRAVTSPAASIHSCLVMVSPLPLLTVAVSPSSLMQVAATASAHGMRTCWSFSSS